MPNLASGGIFLSYRREDTGPYVRLLKGKLRERFPDVRVFMDLDSIEPGVDFTEAIRDAVDSCAVLVTLIGRQWASLADEQGRRRLDDPGDFVRFEIQAALERGVRVIPVLVDGATPLRSEQLPAELHKLARLNALELSHNRYDYEMDRLLNLIQGVLATAAGTGILPEPSPTANAEALAGSHDVRPEGNAAGQPTRKDSEVSRKDQARTIRMLIDAKRAAESITDAGSRAMALADTARALAVTDPERAAQLSADAERIAQSITGEGSRAMALADTARALATTDPERAARLIADAKFVAHTITDKRSKARVLAGVARAVAATDPDHAERIARSITSEGWKARALAGIAGVLAATDADGATWLSADAERIAQSITNEASKARALADVARTLAASDPDYAARLSADAERIAQSITSEDWRASVLVDVARAVAATDPDRAEGMAQSITSEDSKASVLVGIARSLAATDPDRAQRIAQSIARESWRVEALVAIAEPSLTWRDTARRASTPRRWPKRLRHLYICSR